MVLAGVFALCEWPLNFNVPHYVQELHALTNTMSRNTTWFAGFVAAATAAVDGLQELLRLKADLQQLLESAAEQEGSSSNGNSSSTAVGTDGHAAQPLETATDDECESRSSSSSSSSSRRQQALDEDHPFATSAIWQLPVLPLFFEADRTAAKVLAKTLHNELAAAGVAVSR
jgi:hypothetical protein